MLQTKKSILLILYSKALLQDHYTLNELQTNIEYDCTLPPNFGKVIEINKVDFYNPLKNKSNARFYSKDENQLSYIDSYYSDSSMALSWKNVRENISFSYPHCNPGRVHRL